MMELQEVHTLLNYIAPYREQGTSFEIIQLGITSGEDSESEQALVASYSAVGVTWWLENFIPHRWGGSWSEQQLVKQREVWLE